MIHNLNLDFNAMWLQTIMESIQCMAAEGSPLVTLAEQGAEAANFIIAERSTGNPRGEPSISTIEESVPKVKQHLQPVTTSVWLIMIHISGYTQNR
jgi:hypothetical protein